MDEPTYEVDEDTRELLTEVLSLAQRVIDLQYDDDTADSLEDMLITLSNRFGIESHTMNITETEEGYLVHKPKKPEAKPRWTPTVISNDLEPE